MEKKPAAKKPAPEKAAAAAKKPVSEKAAVAAKKPVSEKTAAAAKKPVSEKAAAAAKKPASEKGAAAKKPASEKAASAKKPASEKAAAVKKPAPEKTAAAKKREEVNLTPEQIEEARLRKKRRLEKKRRARRKRMIKRVSIAVGVLAVVLVAAFFLTNTVIDGQIYPLSALEIDLSGRGLTHARGVARLKNLDEALLADNSITDASALSKLTNCEYIDLTGNPVTPESYAALKAALPSCLILCEAEDNTTTELALGGYPLPDLESLAAVFESHKALELVDLRGTYMPKANVDALCARFPQISFMYSADMEDNTLLLKLTSAADAADAIQRSPNAAHVTVTGAVFTPDEYRALQAQFPGIKLDCMLMIGADKALASADQIDLGGSAMEAISEEDLSLFRNLQKLTVGECLPTEAARIKEKFGLTELNYVYNGAAVSAGTTEIDLSGAKGLNAEELKALMSALPQVKMVSMDTADDAMLPVIIEYRGKVQFNYEIEAFGRTFTTATESIDFGDDIKDSDVEELYTLISHLPALKEALMYESKLTQASMDKLFDAYPDVFFGWTFEMCSGKYKVRTDVTAFSTLLGRPTKTFTQKNFEQLRYCKNLQALDLGHNDITDIEFMRNFPKMKVLILADNDITDISPLAELYELEYIELFMNYNLKDYSPLANLKNLIDLNICCERKRNHDVNVEDFLGMTSLERLWMSKTHLDEDEEEMLYNALPNCNVCITWSHSTGDGWREHERYDVIYRIFQTGVYEPFE